tara:strand:+ start:2971 stop:3357 length:387 start_codon:yes stop_codon:yes gene_type:complete
VIVVLKKKNPMKCFNHAEIDAVAICKNCNKGLCKDCLTEVENGIACTATCVEEVNQVNSLINRNKQSYNTASGAYMRNAYIYGGMGIIFIIFGLQTEGLTGFLSLMGLLFLVGAGFSINSAKKFKKGQ